MKSLVLKPMPIEFEDNCFIRNCKIEKFDENLKTNEQIVWFKFPTSIKLPQDNDCDSYLRAMLMDAI